MTPERSSISSKDRTSIISAVKTPLGFFVLVVLVAEGILGALSGAALSGSDRSVAVWGMIVLLGVLIAVVVLLAVFRPGVLEGARNDGKLRIDVQQARARAEKTQKANDELRADYQRCEEQNRALSAENVRLNEKISRIDSVRSRIWAILIARGSADLSQIMGDLDITLRGPAYDQVLGLLGSMAEEGKVQRDTSTGGHYYMVAKR